MKNSIHLNRKNRTTSQTSKSMSSNASRSQASSSTQPGTSSDVSQKPQKFQQQLPWNPVFSLRKTKRQLQVLYHRESRQARILQILSDQTAFWAFAGTLPFIFYLRNVQVTGRSPSFLPADTSGTNPAKISLVEVHQKTLPSPGQPFQVPSIFTSGTSPTPNVPRSFLKLQSRSQIRKGTSLNSLFQSYPVKKQQVVEQNKNESLQKGLTWSETNQLVSVYQKIELGKSPRRQNRFETTQSPLQNRGTRRRQKGQTGSRSTRVPSIARLLLETTPPSVGFDNLLDSKILNLENNPIPGLVTRARWQEKRVALLQQRVRQREELEVRVSKGLKSNLKTTTQRDSQSKAIEKLENVSSVSSFPSKGRNPIGSTIQGVFDKHSQLAELPPIEHRVGVPYQTIEQIKVGGETTEHLVGSRQGPTFIPRASNILRRSFYLTQRRFDREDAARLLQVGSLQEKSTESSASAPQLARYAVRSERQQETAEERLGIAQWAARTARRYRDGNLTADRPYRAVRIGHFQFGRRSHPGYAARRRLYRRRSRNALRVQSLVAKRGGFPRGRLLSSSFTCRFPERDWTRYVRGHDLRLSQAQRRWWRTWHRQDPSLYGELRRAGRRFRERAGRKNLGWWRSLVARPRDSVFRGSSKAPILVKPLQDVFDRSNSKPFFALNTNQNWFEQRAVPLGWASRLKDPTSLQQVLARDLAGRPDAKLPFWLTLPARTPEQRFQTPFTLAILYLSWQIRTKAYNSVQADFLRAREALLRRGGVRERDPEWRSWLLEALGISRTSAGIRQYPPGDRTLARHLAGLRRDLPRWRERLSYLRYNRYYKSEALFLGKKQAAPRPTLLVGAPGTGKTSLVRILADEAGVPVIYQCLAAFTDAGARFTAFGFGRTVAPQAVQRGFDEARRAIPSILFLDEIDALGATRSSKEGKHFQADPTSGTTDRSEKNTQASGDQRLGLGQLLVEIDAGIKNSGLVLFAATNRPEGLDPALVRPGRLDRTVSVPLPNRTKRRSILKLYAGRFGSLSFDQTQGPSQSQGAILDESSWKTWATRTRGLSAAHLASLRNTACLVSVLADKQKPSSTVPNSHEIGFSSLFESSLEVALTRLQTGSSALENSLTFEAQVVGKTIQQQYSIAAQKVVKDVLVQQIQEHPTSFESDFRASVKSSREIQPQGQLFQRRVDRWRQLCWYRAGRAGGIRCQLTGCSQVEELTGSFSYLQAASRLSRTLASENIQHVSNLSSRNFFQAEEFQSDPKLLQYLLDFGFTFNYEKPLAPVYQEAKETLDWPAEWYGFEIPEVPGFRSVGWIPPELHKTVTIPGNQLNVELERQILFQGWNETLWLLLKNRVQLDLVVAKLRE
jgi:ATPase family associated with various cellular activities (AAA)